jgi:hypothetical protein
MVGREGAADQRVWRRRARADTRDGSPLMTPREVMALHPAPAYVVYE